MIKLLTSSITLLGFSIGLDTNNSEYHRDYSESLVLKEYVSPTKNLDPWESFNNKKHQEISDSILQKEIELWKN